MGPWKCQSLKGVVKNIDSLTFVQIAVFELLGLEFRMLFLDSFSVDFQ